MIHTVGDDFHDPHGDLILPADFSYRKTFEIDGQGLMPACQFLALLLSMGKLGDRNEWPHVKACGIWCPGFQCQSDLEGSATGMEEAIGDDDVERLDVIAEGACKAGSDNPTGTVAQDQGLRPYPR